MADDQGFADSVGVEGYLSLVAIRAVVFDLFDTLVDLSMESLPKTSLNGREFPSTMGGLHDALREHTELSFDDFSKALLAVDREHGGARYREHREFPTILRFEVLCERLELTAPHLPQLLTDVHMGMIQGCASVPDHHPGVLEALCARVPVGLCSNFSDSATAQRVLNEAGMTRHFQAVVISEDVGLRKPHTGIFEVVADRLGVVPTEILHVGDNLEADVAGGNATGMQTAWLTRRVKGRAEKLSAYGGDAPTFELEDISEILPLLEPAGAARER